MNLRDKQDSECTAQSMPVSATVMRTALKREGD